MSEFDCDYCGDQGMCEYKVTLFDMTKVELCEDCLDRESRADRVIVSQRFVGLAEKKGVRND